MSDRSSRTRRAATCALALVGLVGLAACSGSSGSDGDAADDATTAANAKRTVTAVATGTAEGVPDTITARVSVSTRGATAAGVLADTSTRMQALLDQLTEAGIDPKDIQTTSVGLGPTYDRDGKITGYASDNSLQVVLRDLETAEIAIKAAQTGHLVLSTLHTNDAPQTLTRLVDMGVKPYAIATSVSLIIAQRLARRLCQACRQPIDVPAEALRKEGFPEEEIAKGMQLFGPRGCPACTDGYKGRLGLYQVMPVTEDIGRIIMAGGNAIDINDAAKKAGVWDLRRAGLAKVQAGMTSLEEINSVTID